MESGNLFCFGKMKENENPKKRFEQLSAANKDVFGPYKGDICVRILFKEKSVSLCWTSWTIERKRYSEKEEFFRKDVTKNKETRK